MRESDNFIKIMLHEERIKTIFNKSKILGQILTNEYIWENSSFYLNLALNFIIIASFSEFYNGSEKLSESKEFIRLWRPSLFGLEYELTFRILNILGATNLAFSSLVVLIFFFKKSPIITIKVWNVQNKSKNYLMRFLSFIINIFLSLRICLTDFSFLYYMFYIAFLILGLAYHPFFYAFHLCDFLRISILKNVLKAIWNPKKQILLTLVVLMLVEYYFSLISYAFFYNHYYEEINEEEFVRWRCNSLWKCFFSTYDYTFKVKFK